MSCLWSKHNCLMLWNWR